MRWVGSVVYRNFIRSACASFSTYYCLKYIPGIFYTGPLPLGEKIHPHSILQVPPKQLAKMSIDPNFVELTADVVRIYLLNNSLR